VRVLHNDSVLKFQDGVGIIIRSWGQL
jgi:hypothetical protein